MKQQILENKARVDPSIHQKQLVDIDNPERRVLKVILGKKSPMVLVILNLPMSNQRNERNNSQIKQTDTFKDENTIIYIYK